MFLSLIKQARYVILDSKQSFIVIDIVDLYRHNYLQGRFVDDVDVPSYNGLQLEVILNSIFASLATHSRMLDAAEPVRTIRSCRLTA